MVRVQIQFTEEQARELRRLAEERNLSVAALTREAVDQMFVTAGIAPPALRAARALEVMGKFGGDEENVAEDHDRYLAEIYGTTG